MEGQVKWFNDNLGYGFIRPDGGGDDVYVHFSQIEGEHKSLSEGEPVAFELTPGEKGPQAAHVRKFSALQH
ncbi:MAG: cold shock domain-containing protein [Desulfuromonadales bacterium]|nr:cold shock domain-containing protein [Desulfuromonadales bacterium]